MTARRPPEAPAPPHTDAAHAAITRELVRLTLGGRPRRRGDPRMPAAAGTVGSIFTPEWVARRIETLRQERTLLERLLPPEPPPSWWGRDWWRR